MINNQHAAALRAAGVACFPCTSDKAPAINRGDDWKVIATRPAESLNWPSQVVGVPVPPGVVVIDLDTYKGVSREDVERALGASLAWDAALIQITQSGGEHYAFRCDYEVIQGANLRVGGEPVEGFDTRAAGRGYIATGGGYRPVGAGVYALACPSALPSLPDSVRNVLEKQERAPIDYSSIPTGDLKVEAITEALAHLDPGCGRSDWVRVGSALRHHFATNEQAGVALFDQWSRGDLGDRGAPHNYDPDAVEHQFMSFKVLGGVTIATLFYDAVKAGWIPPSDLDTSEAFGPGASVDVYGEVLDRIVAHGADPKQTNGLVQAIGSCGGNALQRATLAAALSRELAEAKLLTKAVKQALEALTSSAGPRVDAPPAQLPDLIEVSQLQVSPLVKASSKHLDNALAMLQETFAGRVARYNGSLRWWQGTYWQPIDDDEAHRIALFALWRTQGTIQNAKGTIQALKHIAPRLTPNSVDRRVYFTDCVLDPMTGATYAHSADNANMSTLSVPYQGQTPAVEFDKWLRKMFEGLSDFKDRVLLLQEIIGWTMINDTLNVQKMIALDGASRAGKGVLLEIIKALQADDVTAVAPFHSLGTPKVQNTFIHHDLVFDFEAKGFSGDRAGASSFLYSMVSNETVSIEQLYANATWRGRLNSKYLIACNGIPTMIDDSGASTNRIHVLHFQRSFKDREDRGLLSRLLLEKQGIALWALDGLRRLIGNSGKFTLPYSSQIAIDQMDEENRPVIGFMHEHVEVNETGKALSKDLWTQYRIYMAACNVPSGTKTQFYKSLRQTVSDIPTVEYVKSMRVGDERGPGYSGLSLPAHMSTTSAAFKVVSK